MICREVLAEQTECYITALQWILNYYYRGVSSWSWYYPHHYAPYISDIRDFKDIDLNFAMGKPFLPFEQLLSVLPAASKELLPPAYHNLMLEPNSKIIEYYPQSFETDLNGKKQEWEALVLIPFIDERLLIDAMSDCNGDLTESEQGRNKHGPMLQYDYCDTDQGSLAECMGLPMIGHVFCKETRVDRADVQVNEENLVLGPCANAAKDAYFPGFPTMRHLKHSAYLEMKRIKVFQQPSRNESMIVKIDEIQPELSITELADKYIGQEVYIGWPHLREARVFAVSDSKTRIEKTMSGQSTVEPFPNGNGEFVQLSRLVSAHHMNRLGLDLGEITQLLHVYTMKNREYVFTNDGRMTANKNWSKDPLAIAPITAVQNLKVFERDLERFKEVQDVYSKDSTIFMMNKGYYGCQATVTSQTIQNGRVKLTALVHPQPDFEQARQLHRKSASEYMNSHVASAIASVNTHLFNKISGICFIVAGEKRFPISDSAKKVNIGLQLKHFKQNEEVPGYVKSTGNQWLYSQKAVELIQAYAMKFPRLFELIGSKSDFVFESELNAGRKSDSDSMLKEIQHWLKEQPHNNISRQPCGTNCLTNHSLEEIVKAVNGLKNAPVRKVTLQVKPHLLYKPNLNPINVAPDPSATFELFDRVVIVRDDYLVPLGLRGTIVSILPTSDPNPVRQENINLVEYIYDVLFDEPFETGITVPDVAEKRFFKVRPTVLMNLTHGLGRLTHFSKTAICYLYYGLHYISFVRSSTQ